MITKKQMNVIYAKVKSGKLSIEKKCISKLYDMVEDWDIYSRFPLSRRIEQSLFFLVQSIFKEDYKAAQKIADEMCEDLRLS